MKTGILLVNLGTPRSTSPEDVGEYLRELLMDPYVITIPRPLRWFLVNALIVPRRKHESAKAYEKVWTKRGSPLLFHTQDLTAGVAKILNGASVKFAMACGEPTLKAAFDEFVREGVRTVKVLPLYPQYADATTRSTFEAAERSAAGRVQIERVEEFFDDEGYLSAWVESIEQNLKKIPGEHVLFTFHGLPESQILKSDLAGKCAPSDFSCCAATDPNTTSCYRAQCWHTARLLAERLGLQKEHWSLSFQSRLGRAKWIGPYTEETLKELGRAGVKRLVVAAPSFVADCLETIEEIGMRGKAAFQTAGGGEFVFVPSLNANPKWVSSVSKLVQ